MISMRNELKIGLGVFALYLILYRFTEAPEFILGLLAGAAICFEIIGILPEKAYNSLKAFKKRIFHGI